MARAGFAAKGLFVMDGSRRSAHANAYFTGFGAAKRVVFFDTLLARLGAGRGRGRARARARPLQAPPHRQAHGRDVRAQPRRASRCSAGSSTQAWFYTGLGVAPEPDAAERRARAAAVPARRAGVRRLRLAAVRRLSRRARVRGRRLRLRARPTAATLASALLKLHEDNASTLTPDPLYVRFYYSHPPAVERLAALVRAAPRPSHHDQLPRSRSASRAPARDERRRDPRPPRPDERLARGRRRDREDASPSRAGSRRSPSSTRWPGSATSKTTTPTCAVRFDRCVVRFSTHSAGGISVNDFICAAKADALVAFARLKSPVDRAGRRRARPALRRRDAPTARASSATRAARRATRVVGDRVRWQAVGRRRRDRARRCRARNLLYRQDEWKTKSFAANLDQLLVVVAAEPVFSESQLARALIAAESAGIPARIVLNKADLPAFAAARGAARALRARWASRCSSWR